MNWQAASAALCVAVMGACDGSGGAALAQSIQAQPLPPVSGGYAPPAAKSAPTSATKQASPKASGTAAKSDDSRAPAEGQLARRVDQLEEQMTDLQVVIGTLESLAKNGGGGGAVSQPLRAQGGGGLSPGEQGRLEALETQVRALTAQVEQLVAQMGGGAAPGRRSDYAAPAPAGGAGLAQAPGIGGFGQTTVTPEQDPIGQIIQNDSRPERTAATGLGGSTGDGGLTPDQLYKQSYSFLLQQNWPEAEQGFDEFLRRYPNDAMAGNAQYWLGEVYFTRGEFKQAASAFLKGSKSYPKSVKAPDSMLMLAMSLDRLGQRDAACQAFNELSTRYPNMPTNLRDRAASGRSKAGC